jgi:ATPase subunit of ABC transporter with duplicated ATPase domains
MIIIKNLTKYILGEPLFEKVSFTLNKNDKIGLVGPNGSGKSTLMKIIIGEVEADGGSVQMDHERIGYLSQQLSFQGTDTVGSFLSEVKSPKIKSALEKVGLNKISNSLPVNKLIGGQKTRLALAKILLQKPSVLLLDEPTNHLDKKGIEWLENFIKDFTGAVMIISHDRKLLDNSVNKILEIDPVNHKFAEYAGGYTEYISERKKTLEKQEGDYNRQQKEKKRLELWLALKKQEAKVHPDPAKGKKIRAMEKRLEREIYSQEIIKPREYSKIKGLDLKGETHSAKLIVRARNISKNFADKVVLWNINFELRGEERALLSGDNGCGKTTLLKIIAGELKPNKGEIRIGEKVCIGYFAQEHENLDPNKTVMEEFQSTDRLVNTIKDPRAILGAFLFHGQDVFKKVSDLSLGERVRLIFSKLTNQENELLILDEPTNHLDIVSREIIENALIDYKGAIIVVSHDRYFIEKISITRTLTFHGGVIGG